MLISLKLNDGINDMFQNLRTGDAAFFVDVADEYHGDATRLGKA